MKYTSLILYCRAFGKAGGLHKVDAEHGRPVRLK